ncbi:MAG TPA: hypothetical protein VFS68_02770, partial [Candidatus Udaeobacter sp.]|nr:hypothetical protein [Candidatus Udaeobacter sp.]
MTNLAAISVECGGARARYGLLLTALAPVVPQILGSAFNIWYNKTIVEPLLTSALKQRFDRTWVLYTIGAFLIGLVLWLKRVLSFRDLFHRLYNGSAIDSESLTKARQRLIHLPWF